MKKAKTGVMFNLKADNGQIICTSQVYSTETACRNGIQSVRTNRNSKIEDQTIENYAVLPNPKYEIYKDVGDSFRFRLKAMNGEIVAASQAYTSKASCLNGIESIKKNASREASIVFLNNEE